MAKAIASSSQKLNFGRRKKGSAKKAFNKHSPRPKEYKGQGR